LHLLFTFTHSTIFSNNIIKIISEDHQQHRYGSEDHHYHHIIRKSPTKPIFKIIFIQYLPTPIMASADAAHPVEADTLADLVLCQVSSDQKTAKMQELVGKHEFLSHGDVKSFVEEVVYNLYKFGYRDLPKFDAKVAIRDLTSESGISEEGEWPVIEILTSGLPRGQKDAVLDDSHRSSLAFYFKMGFQVGATAPTKLMLLCKHEGEGKEQYIPVKSCEDADGKPGQLDVVKLLRAREAGEIELGSFEKASIEKEQEVRASIQARLVKT
jgi:hypothetical protein